MKTLNTAYLRSLTDDTGIFQQEAYKILGDHTYIIKASLCNKWYLGHNSLHESLIDSQTGGCYDGIHASGLNLNQGSESVISYAIAHMVTNHE